MTLVIYEGPNHEASLQDQGGSVYGPAERGSAIDVPAALAAALPPYWVLASPATSSIVPVGTGPGSSTPGDTPRRRLNIVASYALIFESNNAFPSLIRGVDPTRQLCVVRNIGVNIAMIKFSANGSGNYNAPSWTGADIINPGEEWVTEGSSAPIFFAPQTQGQGVTAAVYTELGVL